MGPRLRVLAFLLATLSTVTARAQQRQPRPHLLLSAAPSAKAEPVAPQPDRRSEQEIARLRQQVVELQAQLAAQRAQAEQNAARLEALQQQSAAVASRGQAIEQNRQQRAARFSEAAQALLRANDILMGGSDETGGLLDLARSLLEGASADAASFGNATEATNGRDALLALTAARDSLSQRDLFQARVALLQAARSAATGAVNAQSYSQPLYLQTP